MLDGLFLSEADEICPSNRHRFKRSPFRRYARALLCRRRRLSLCDEAETKWLFVEEAMLMRLKSSPLFQADFHIGTQKQGCDKTFPQRQVLPTHLAEPSSESRQDRLMIRTTMRRADSVVLAGFGGELVAAYQSLVVSVDTKSPSDI